jgi:hypothetical protein
MAIFPPASATRPKTLSDVVKRVIDPDFSYRAVTIVSGAGVLEIGQVLGRVTASGKFGPHDNALSNGQEAARAILVDPVDATAADREALALVFGGHVNTEELIFKAGISAGNKAAAIAALEAQQILVRES